jgi:hypothetical protein
LDLLILEISKKDLELKPMTAGVIFIALEKLEWANPT